jgi:hypothetical protein
MSRCWPPSAEYRELAGIPGGGHGFSRAGSDAIQVFDIVEKIVQTAGIESCIRVDKDLFV